jgi:hypothetical protein
MNTVTFSFPTTIRFGLALSALFQGTRTSWREPSARRDRSWPGCDEAFGTLQRALVHDVHVFSEVHPNPIEADVEAAARDYATQRCDGIIAFGGGSALDVGKAVRLRARRPERSLRDFDFQLDWSGLPPCVAVRPRLEREARWAGHP